MKAVILAAGKSTRTHPITVDTPKALVRVAGKPLIEHILEPLEGLVDEAVLVLGFRGKMIREALGEDFRGIKLTYAEQSEQLGTGHALLSAEPFTGMEDFLVMMGDDLYSREVLERVAGSPCSLLAVEVGNPSAYGVWLEKEGKVSGFQEKPENPESCLANCGLYRLGPEIYSHIRKLRKTPRGEYELNEAVNSLARDKPVSIIRSDGGWIPVGYPWDFLRANAFLLRGMDPRNEGELEEGVTMKGPVYIGKGTIVKSGTYIEGPVMIGRDCTIGPHAYIRPDTFIDNGCHVRGEVYDSVMLEGTTAKHACYIGHSVTGRNANIAGGTLTTDYRHDGKEHVTLVKGRKVSTGRRKLGAFLGDGVHTGAGTIIYPGRKLWPGRTTLPGQVVRMDIE